MIGCTMLLQVIPSLPSECDPLMRVYFILVLKDCNEGLAIPCYIAEHLRLLDHLNIEWKLDLHLYSC